MELDKEASCILNNGTCLNDLDIVESLDPVGDVVGRQTSGCLFSAPASVGQR